MNATANHSSNTALDSGPPARRRCFFIVDHLGSKRAIIDSDSSVQARFDYDPFGMVYADSTINTSKYRYLYTGQEYEPELGICNYRARMYDPLTGRFISPDPAGQGFSPYTYCGGNPVSSTDPTGMVFNRLLFGTVGSIATGLAGSAMGVGLGAVIGAFTAGIRWGAGIGAIAGAGLGLLRASAEVLNPVLRRFRRTPNELPIILISSRSRRNLEWAEAVAQHEGIPAGVRSHYICAMRDGRVLNPADYGLYRGRFIVNDGNPGLDMDAAPGVPLDLNISSGINSVSHSISRIDNAISPPGNPYAYDVYLARNGHEPAVGGIAFELVTGNPNRPATVTGAVGQVRTDMTPFRNGEIIAGPGPSFASRLLRDLLFPFVPLGVPMPIGARVPIGSSTFRNAWRIVADDGAFYV